MAEPIPLLVTLDTEAAGQLSLKAFSSCTIERFLSELVFRALKSETSDIRASLANAAKDMAAEYWPQIPESGIQQSPVKVKKPRRPRADKDPNAPKRPLTAFMFFSKAVRSTVKAENPHMSFGELGTAIAALWVKTPAEARQAHYESAARDKERYERNMAAYKASLEGFY